MAEPIEVDLPESGPDPDDRWLLSTSAAATGHYLMEKLLRSHDSELLARARVLAMGLRETRGKAWGQLQVNFRPLFIKPAELSRFRSLDPAVAVELYGAASVNANGYTREAAVRALAELRHPRAVPYLLLRFGDSVPQVRAAADQAFESLDPRQIAAVLIENHLLVDHLLECKRVDLSARHTSILDLLRRPELRAAAEAGLRVRWSKMRRFCFRLLANEAEGQERRFDQALIDPCPYLRCDLARLMANHASPSALERLRGLICDPSNQVKSIALRSLNPAQAQELRAELVELSLFEARPVRELARWHLKPLGELGLVEKARERIAAAEPAEIAPGWVASLGELGSAERDFETAEALRHHRRPRLRGAAVTAMSKLDAPRTLPSALEALEDPSSRVRLAALSVLRNTSRCDWLDEVKSLLRTGTDCGRQAALLALNEGMAWDSLAALLPVLLSEDPKLRGLAWVTLDRWQGAQRTNRWLRPRAQDLEAIAAIWPSVVSLPAPDWMRDLWADFKAELERLLKKS
jgi:HEAT repeat protein